MMYDNPKVVIHHDLFACTKDSVAHRTVLNAHISLCLSVHVFPFVSYVKFLCAGLLAPGLLALRLAD